MIICFAKQLYRKARYSYYRTKGLIPNLVVSRHNYKLVKLGSPYGGWTLIDSNDLYNSVIISCGLGEDASFDIEFASRFNSKIIIVDPTPRSIMHFKEIIQRLGQTATATYSVSGKQQVEAYDLSTISLSNIILIKKALWNKSQKLKFYQPANQSHVSHSIVNFQNDYRTDTAFIEVEAITMVNLIESLQIGFFPIIKLDIEGAEIEVILDMMGKKIHPNQILIEYDEINKPSQRSKQRIESAHNALLENGYQLINYDYPSNFLYVKSNAQLQ